MKRNPQHRRVAVAATAAALIALPAVAPLPAFALQAPAPAAPSAAEGIVMQGVGEVTAKPDIARLTLGVETRDAEAAKAAEENARLTDAVIKAIRAAGVAEKDVQTSGYSIYRTEEPNGLGGSGFSGGRSFHVGQAGGQGQPPQAPRTRVVFVARNTVQVTVRKVADAGKVIDAAVKAGANVAGGIQFDFADPKPLEDEALRLAVLDAARKAKVVGRASGYGSLRLVSVAEASADFPRPMFGGAMMSARADMAQTPVEPGEQKITARVTVRYVLSDLLTGPGVIKVE